MERVTGIGGVFFKAKNPTDLSKWYMDNLGISMPPQSYDQAPWHQEKGPTIFAPMREESTHFRESSNLYINFRVVDLDAMCRQLSVAGLTVNRDDEIYPNGRFASLEDPEGNQIQLWEPK